MPALIPLAIAGGTAIAGIAGAKIGANATRDSATLATDANTTAATLQAKSAADALAFQRQQAETAWQTSQQTQKANYDQWAAREGRLKSLGAMTGITRADPPPFAPGIDPRFTPGASPLPSTTTASPTMAGAPGGDPIHAALIDTYRTLGVTPTGPGSGPTDIAYMAGKIQQTGGLTPANVNYWFGPTGRIATELAATRGGAQAPAATTAPFSIATAAYGTPAPILAPGVSGMPPSQPYSFANRGTY